MNTIALLSLLISKSHLGYVINGLVWRGVCVCVGRKLKWSEDLLSDTSQ